MKNERWIVVPTDYLVREDNEGLSLDTGELTIFPYKRCEGAFLEGYHAATKKRLHTYGPFASMEEMETFAREHHIDLQAK